METLLLHLSILHPLSTLPPPLNDPFLPLQIPSSESPKAGPLLLNPLNDPFLPLQIPSSESPKAGPLLLNPSSMPASDTQEMADAADSNAAEARSKIKEMASTITTSKHRIYCAVTGPLPAETLPSLFRRQLKEEVSSTGQKETQTTPPCSTHPCRPSP
ncbi:hypothetical protein ACHWQZ_G001911 [Mnemiopsis leidyi]